MTAGVGGSDAATELEALGAGGSRLAGAKPIGPAEYRARLDLAGALLREHGMGALYLNAGSSLRYFTGTVWSPSERLVGALLTADGSLHYLAPAFERGTLEGYAVLAGTMHCWEEHECPYRLLAAVLRDNGVSEGRLAVDPAAPWFLVDGVRTALPAGLAVANGAPVVAGCRERKSAAELALMQRAKDITLEVHRHTARMLSPGISTAEVEAFIHAAHQAAGTGGSTFCIVLFGPDSAFPHGVAKPKVLEDGDMVLIDTGCEVHGYLSDITRSYVFGEPSAPQREIWNLEKAAQQAAFDAARPGVACGAVDAAARAVIEDAGLGPGYRLPGLPHRTGHGIGLDIHESPYLLPGNETPLAPGMCFSNEPMICVPGEFGVRLEDHFHVTDDGARWFTEPSPAIDAPFGDR
ncbi:MAG TPA: Xaa-Pro peptidase family protein [Pseudohaliea sp.]|nr:Xaa-Pro peptidase family protein [Pseudohaliea sp.]